MAKKHGILGPLLAVGGIAVAGTLVYRKNREVIHTFLEELGGAQEDLYEVRTAEIPVAEEPDGAEPEVEVDIVIDRTGAPDENEGEN